MKSKTKKYEKVELSELQKGKIAMLEKRLDIREQKLLKQLAEEKAKMKVAVEDVNKFREMVRLEFNELMLRVRAERAEVRLECLKLAAEMAKNSGVPYDEEKVAGSAELLLTYVVGAEPLQLVMPTGLDVDTRQGTSLEAAIRELKPKAEA